MSYSLKDLEGKWYIVFTNFPMWLKGDKKQPTFNYKILDNRLLDEVKYIKNGREKTITGYDTPENTENSKFTWCGKGLLGLLSSKWEIKKVSADKTWMLIYFKKTLFTPEGYDIVSRKTVQDAETLEKMSTEIMNIPSSKQIILIQ